MNSNQLIIPKKCKVGFNIRSDTYTGKLGYVIFHDGKVWRKEKSWETWRKKPGERVNNYYNSKDLSVYGEEVAPVEFDNIPTTGFVLNKKAGGTCWSWNTRATYCRVYDPRGFEFEISIQNLLFILQETNSMKGKGLEGEFVYSWDGKDLVLLPCQSNDYAKSNAYTSLQSEKISVKEMIVGAEYLTDKEQTWIFLGKLDYYNRDSYDKRYSNISSKKFVFVNDSGEFFGLDSLSKKIKRCVSVEPVTNFAELVVAFDNSIYANSLTKIVKDEIVVEDDFKPMNGRLVLKDGSVLCDKNHRYCDIRHDYYDSSKFYLSRSSYIFTDGIVPEYAYSSLADRLTKMECSSLKELLDNNTLYRTKILTTTGKLIPNTLR